MNLLKACLANQACSILAYCSRHLRCIELTCLAIFFQKEYHHFCDAKTFLCPHIWMTNSWGPLPFSNQATVYISYFFSMVHTSFKPISPLCPFFVIVSAVTYQRRRINKISSVVSYFHNYYGNNMVANVCLHGKICLNFRDG